MLCLFISLCLVFKAKPLSLGKSSFTYIPWLGWNNQGSFQTPNLLPSYWYLQSPQVTLKKKKSTVLLPHDILAIISFYHLCTPPWPILNRYSGYIRHSMQANAHVSYDYTTTTTSVIFTFLAMPSTMSLESHLCKKPLQWMATKTNQTHSFASKFPFTQTLERCSPIQLISMLSNQPTHLLWHQIPTLHAKPNRPRQRAAKHL